MNTLGRVYITIDKPDDAKLALDKLKSMGYQCTIDFEQAIIKNELLHIGVLYGGYNESRVFGSNNRIGWDAKGNEILNGRTQVFIDGVEKHKHYDDIVKWASDPTQKVWWLDESNCWKLVTNPSWFSGNEYYVGIEPPINTIRIGERVITKPISKPLKVGELYFVATLNNNGDGHMQSVWDDDAFDHARLKMGIIHLTKEDAINHSNALIEISGGQV